MRRNEAAQGLKYTNSRGLWRRELAGQGCYTRPTVSEKERCMAAKLRTVEVEASGRPAVANQTLEVGGRDKLEDTSGRSSTVENENFRCYSFMLERKAVIICSSNLE